MGHRRSYQGMLVPALRRVQGVRLTVEDDGVRAEVYGIGHRHPVSVPISVRLAARLVEAGAPLSVRHAGIRHPMPKAVFSS